MGKIVWTFCEAHGVCSRRYQCYILSFNIDPTAKQWVFVWDKQRKGCFPICTEYLCLCLLHPLLYQPLHSPNNQLHPSAVWTLCHQFPEKWQMLWWTACQLVSKLDNTWRSEVFVTTSPLPLTLCLCVFVYCILASAHTSASKWMRYKYNCLHM